MKRYTVDDILKLKPCPSYTRRKIQKLWGKRKSLSLVSILRLGVPTEDRLWVGCGLADHRTLVAWCCDCAERALPIFEKKYPKDLRPRKAIETTRAWLAGKATLEEVKKATNAAHAASYAAARAARGPERAWQSTRMIEYIHGKVALPGSRVITKERKQR